MTTFLLRVSPFKLNHFFWHLNMWCVNMRMDECECAPDSPLFSPLIAELPGESARREERCTKNQSGAKDKLHHSWQIISRSIRDGEGRFVYLTPSHTVEPSSSCLYPPPQPTLFAVACHPRAQVISCAAGLRVTQRYHRQSQEFSLLWISQGREEVEYTFFALLMENKVSRWLLTSKVQLHLFYILV